MEYFVQPDNSECADIWNILYSQTFLNALIYGIFCTVRQFWVRWYMVYFVQPDSSECTDVWNILYSQTGLSALIYGIFGTTTHFWVRWCMEYFVQPDRSQWANMWNILYIKTGQSALIYGIYFSSRQVTVRWQSLLCIRTFPVNCSAVWRTVSIPYTCTRGHCRSDATTGTLDTWTWECVLLKCYKLFNRKAGKHLI